MAAADLTSKTGRELAALIKSKQVSPVDIAKAYLDRIHSLNAHVNAFITVTDDVALKQARAAEKQIVAGKYIGPLHGLPYAPKDILATKGIKTTNGSKVTADWVPTYESTITARMAKAGAVMLGKLNLLEFAMGSGVDSGFGPARNPWHLDYSPGGSSSGSGAALIADMVPLAIGTDTGGSIRVPAANCGIVGLKQTYGRVSRYGVTTLSWTLDHAGPMTRSVADAADMLQVIAGADPKDPTAVRRAVPDYAQLLSGGVKGIRIGVPTNYFFEDAHAEIDKGVRAAIAQLKDMGATVVDIELPHAKYASSAGWIIAMAEGACFHEQRLKERAELFDPLVRERLEAAQFYTATDYIKAQRLRTVLMNEMHDAFRKCDVMAVPGSGQFPGKLDTPEIAKSDVKPGSVASPYRGGNTFFGDMTGQPSMVQPCGFSSGDPALPITIMFYGRPFDEATIFRVGHAYESATDWHTRRPKLDASGRRPTA